MRDQTTFLAFRLSLLAALGLGAAACGAEVNGGSGAAGAGGGSTSQTTGAGSQLLPEVLRRSMIRKMGAGFFAQIMRRRRVGRDDGARRHPASLRGCR